jgi:hypothetical protein
MFVLYILYSCVNILNDIFGIIVIAKGITWGIAIFIGIEGFVMVVSTFVSFSPLVFFHLGILLLSIQTRFYLLRHYSDDAD